MANDTVRNMQLHSNSPVRVVIFNGGELWLATDYLCILFSYILGYFKQNPTEFVRELLRVCAEESTQEFLHKGALVVDKQVGGASPFIRREWEKLKEKIEAQDAGLLDVFYEGEECDEQDIIDNLQEFFEAFSKRFVKKLLKDGCFTEEQLKKKHIRFTAEARGVFTAIIADRPQQADMIELEIYNA